MKQRITVEQLQELSEEQKISLADYWGKYGNNNAPTVWVNSNDDINLKYQLPLLDVSQTRVAVRDMQLDRLWQELKAVL